MYFLDKDPSIYDDTRGKLPQTPFPGVAPVPTIRRQCDGSYDQGLDMGDGKGRAPNYVCQDYGDGGKLGVSNAKPTAAPKPQPTYDFMMPRRGRRGK